MADVTLLDAFIDPHKMPPAYSFGLIASAALVGTAAAVRGSMKLVPKGAQNVIEAVVEAMHGLAVDNAGAKWGRRITPLVGTLFVYILLCNFMGLVPGFATPTSNINVNLAMALPVFFLTHYYGLMNHGAGYIKHFVGPLRSPVALPLMVLMFFIELVGHLVRPVTLSVRLFGNMLAKHIILGVLATLAPVLVPILVLALGTLVSVIQAFVFALLATLYLAGSIEEAH